ncbi:MAG: tetraacyldisaccharide 4'-kinase [Betaproteobacteria bacterium]
MPTAAGISSVIARHWIRRDAVSLALYPLSLLFRLLVALRRGAYRLGIFSSSRLAVPVVVVGNLTVGGSGKTPLVIALAQELARRGLQPGIVSRGHGGSGTAPRAVRQNGEAADFGDEPLLLARKCGGPVWVGRDRAAAGAALLAAHAQCDLLLLDDGLQHYALARDFEIAVEDARGFGNGFMLPAGPLREPAARPVDARVINTEPAARPVDARVINTEPAVRPVDARVINSGPDDRRASPAAATFSMRLATRRLYRLDDPARDVAAAELAGLRLHAVAGIGNPARFFAQLDALGLACATHAFPDHHVFTPQDVLFDDCDAVLMTEKDAVKCTHFGRTDLYALEVQAEIDPALIELILRRIHGRTPA